MKYVRLGTCSTRSLHIAVQSCDTNTAYTGQAVLASYQPLVAAGTTSIIGSLAMIAAADGAATNWTLISRESRTKAMVEVSYRVYQNIGSNCTTPPIFNVRPAMDQLGY